MALWYLGTAYWGVSHLLLPNPVKVWHEPATAEAESRLTARLGCPGVVVVHDAGTDGAVAFLVMEKVDGTSLAITLEAGPMAPDRAAKVAAQLARTLSLVHAEGERAPSPLETVGATADFAYLRLRAREGYDAAAVATWAERLAAVRASGKDVYAYFRHDEDGSNGLAAEALRDALA